MNLKPQTTLRWIAMSLGTLVLLMSAVVARVYQAGAAAVAESDRAFDAGHLLEATSAAREAASWYLPQAPHVARAHQRLRAIAIGAESQGDVTTALRAWGALRAALIETDHPWSARDRQVGEASQAVARLLLVEQQRASKVPAAADTAREAELLEAYGKPIASGRALFSVLTSVGMFLMLGCGLLLLSRHSVVSAKGGVLVQTGLLVGLGLWVLAALGA